MEVCGVKPGSQAASRPNGPKLEMGERLSMCGKFAINGGGSWRELPAEQRSSQPHEFPGIGPDGKPLVVRSQS